MQLLRFTSVSGITLLGQLAPGKGGTQVSVFRSGSQAGTAALLANADNLVVFFNLSTAQETRRVSVAGNPFRIAPDDVNGKLIVAIFDVTTGGTKFVSLNPADGSATDLAATVPFLATWVAVSADGTKIYAGNRDQFRILQNQ
jgi:DNA-binding beta-propeller fold protein YncE